MLQSRQEESYIKWRKKTSKWKRISQYKKSTKGVTFKKTEPF